MSAMTKNSVTELLSRTRSAGDEIRDSLESIRRRVRELSVKRAEILDQPESLDVIAERIRVYVSQNAANPMARWPNIEVFRSPRFQTPMSDLKLDTLFAYLAPVLIEAMIAQARAADAIRPGISPEARQTRVEALDRELLDAELAEESIIRAAEQQGFPIARRGDADPRAVLAHDKALP